MSPDLDEIGGVALRLIRVCVTLRVRGRFQGEHSRLQQLYAGASVHGAFERLQAIDLPLGLAAAPLLSDGIPDGFNVTAQYPRDLLHGANAGMLRIIKPWSELAGVSPTQ